MTLRIAERIQELINKNYEYISNDISPSNGNDIFIFKDKNKRFAIEVYEWVD